MARLYQARGRAEMAALELQDRAGHARAMTHVFSGLFGFLLCLLIGILADQVALGILAGLFLGAFFGSRKAKARAESADASEADPN
jgi:hypothetical protein